MEEAEGMHDLMNHCRDRVTTTSYRDTPLPAATQANTGPTASQRPEVHVIRIRLQIGVAVDELYAGLFHYQVDAGHYGIDVAIGSGGRKFGI